MGWSSLIEPMQRRFRRQRAMRILDRYPEITGSTVIDIGGSLTFWKSVGDLLKPGKVMIYNISSGRMSMGMQNKTDYIETHIYDGEAIPHADKSADFVICNSVIEHVPLDGRARLAEEIIRVGQRYVVQTPAREFPLEMHFGLPFIHWLPRPLGRAIVPVSPFGLLVREASARKYFDRTQLLSHREFAGYFPESQIEVERFVGIPKSMLAFG